MMIGISAEPDADRGLLRGAGIGWMRFDFPFPFEDRHGGALTERYRKARAQAEALVRDGIRLLGITPLPGYGNWEPGLDDELHAMTGKKVLLNEWGFSSVGGVASPEEHESGKRVCALKKWHYTWGNGHTPESQASYVRVVFDAIRKHRDVVMGTFFYRLDDQSVCGQCHQPDCPAETGWGIVDAFGKPKPAYHAFAEGAAREGRKR